MLERKDSINNARQQSLVDLQTGATLIPFGKYRDVEYSDKCGYVLTYTSDSTWQVFDFSGKLCLEGTKEKTASIRITPYGVLNLQNYHVGFIPFEGKTIKPIYKKISFFDNKLGITTQVDTINWEQKQGIITAGGEMLVKPCYNEIYMENNHIKVIVYGKTAHDHAKEGILNLNGKVIIAPDKYNTIEYFSEDNVAVVSKSKYNDDKPSDFGLIDSKGKILVPVKYRRVYHKNGIAQLETHWPADSNRIIMGMYNIKTRKMIEPKYDDMKEFVNGISIIGYFNSTGNRYGLLDENGNEIVSPIYETMFYNDTQQYATVSLNKKQGMINAQGKVIVPIIFDRFTEYRPQNNKNGIVIGQNQNGYAVYNFYTEKEMLPLGKYDKVMCTNEGFLYTIHDRRIYCTPDGKEIVQQP